MMKTTKRANLELVSWMIGNWIGKNGILKAPNNKTANFKEHLEVSRATETNSILHLKFISWLECINGKKSYQCMESGFLKLKTQSFHPEYFIYASTHNHELVMIEEGDLENNVLTLESTSIARSNTARPFYIAKTKKVITKVDANNINFKMMITTTVDPIMKEFLTVDFERID